MICISSAAFGLQPYSTSYLYGNAYQRLSAYSSFTMPYKDTVLLTDTTRAGSMVMRPADNKVYVYNGTYWTQVGCGCALEIGATQVQGYTDGGILYTNGSGGLSTSTSVVWDGSQLVVNGAINVANGHGIIVDGGPNPNVFNVSGYNVFAAASAGNGIRFTSNNASSVFGSFMSATGDFLINTTTDNGTDKLQVNGSASASVFKCSILTFAGLPSSPETGMIATITDCSTNTFNAIANGSGAFTELIWYNGVNWIVR